jgi:hypothetical protein
MLWVGCVGRKKENAHSGNAVGHIGTMSEACRQLGAIAAVFGRRRAVKLA